MTKSGQGLKRGQTGGEGVKYKCRAGWEVKRENNKMSQEAKGGWEMVVVEGIAVRCILMLSPFNLLPCKHTQTHTE